jgi:hypothetical protein
MAVDERKGDKAVSQETLLWIWILPLCPVALGLVFWGAVLERMIREPQIAVILLLVSPIVQWMLCSLLAVILFSCDSDRRVSRHSALESPNDHSSATTATRPADCNRDGPLPFAAAPG